MVNDGEDNSDNIWQKASKQLALGDQSFKPT